MTFSKNTFSGAGKFNAALKPTAQSVSPFNQFSRPQSRFISSANYDALLDQRLSKLLAAPGGRSTESHEFLNKVVSESRNQDTIKIVADNLPKIEALNREVTSKYSSDAIPTPHFEMEKKIEDIKNIIKEYLATKNSTVSRTLEFGGKINIDLETFGKRNFTTLIRPEEKLVEALFDKFKNGWNKVNNSATGIGKYINNAELLKSEDIEKANNVSSKQAILDNLCDVLTNISNTYDNQSSKDRNKDMLDVGEILKEWQEIREEYNTFKTQQKEIGAKSSMSL